MDLIDSIRARILKYGAIPFVDFMQQALYAPNAGYYNSIAQKFGSAGDFITAPELSSLFGRTLAHQCLQVLSQVSNPAIFEFGAGSGRLCVDILSELARLDALPCTYYILELSGVLQQRQRALILEKIPHLYDIVTWLSHWPDHAFNGVMIANEVLDAMPVHRFLQTDTELLESHIGLDASQNLCELFLRCTDQRLSAHVQRVLPQHKRPYQGEANLFIDGWIAKAYASLAHGAFFIIDYGFPRHEYYHPDRNTGTLMCHYQQRTHANPLLHVGLQDISAHVDFSHVAEAADKVHFHVAGYTNQAAFLLANGILERSEPHCDERMLIQNRQALKKLLNPHEMGELFKVMALTKNIKCALDGFLLQDKRASL